MIVAPHIKMEQLLWLAWQGFMIQTGDPQGDGTGGESIWGGEFEALNRLTCAVCPMVLRVQHARRNRSDRWQLDEYMQGFVVRS